MIDRTQVHGAGGNKVAAFAAFTLDEGGRAAGFKMKLISLSTDFSYDFQDLDLQRVD